MSARRRAKVVPLSAPMVEVASGTLEEMFKPATILLRGSGTQDGAASGGGTAGRKGDQRSDQHHGGQRVERGGVVARGLADVRLRPPSVPCERESLGRCAEQAACQR